jgi:hypothetical protein
MPGNVRPERCCTFAVKDEAYPFTCLLEILKAAQMNGYGRFYGTGINRFFQVEKAMLKS